MNYFDILQIAPTRDKNLVKQAFKKRVLEVHPDRTRTSESNEECGKVIEAWNCLSNQDNLNAYYNEVSHTTHPSSSSKAEASDATPPSRPATVKDAPFKAGEKITVFIPVSVAFDNHHKSMSSDYVNSNDLENAKSYGCTDINHDRLLAKNVDFAIIAEIMNSFMQHRPFYQVGLDTDEVNSIVNQHSWYKRCTGHIYVEAKVSAKDLYDRASEQAHYGPNVANARDGCFFALKQKTMIKAEDIMGFSLGAGQWWLSNHPALPQSVCNENSIYCRASLISISETAEAKSSDCLQPVMNESHVSSSSSSQQSGSSTHAIYTGVLNILGLFATRLFSGKTSAADKSELPAYRKNA